MKLQHTYYLVEYQALSKLLNARMMFLLYLGCKTARLEKNAHYLLLRSSFRSRPTHVRTYRTPISFFLRRICVFSPIFFYVKFLYYLKKTYSLLTYVILDGQRSSQCGVDMVSVFFSPSSLPTFLAYARKAKQRTNERTRVSN